MAKKKLDFNQRAKSIVDQLTGSAPREEPTPAPADDGKNKAAVELGRLGGLKGGKARADKLPPSVRAKIARKAAAARWAKKKKTPATYSKSSNKEP